MIGLDTNALVRYIVDDEPSQARRATEFIESECTLSTPGWICHPVLCELVWVLDSGYGFSRLEIANTLRKLLSVERLSVERPEIACQALREFEVGKADFSDYLIRITNQSKGAECTYTFDRNACTSPLFKPIP